MLSMAFIYVYVSKKNGERGKGRDTDLPSLVAAINEGE